MVTTKENTFSAHWPMTKQNTWYGYKLNDNYYQWYKTKRAVLRKLKGTKRGIYRATLINGTMYINMTYLTFYPWQ